MLGERAVVCGAGMAGLLAAKVLSDFYESVVLVERDRLPDTAAQRRGVPQGRHFHALMSRGSQELDRLFPGLLDELAAAGATVCDDGGLSRVSMWVGGHELNRSATFADPAGAVLYLVSRPFLESHVRRRVRAIDNVMVTDGHDVVEPIGGPNRVTGVRAVNRDTGAQQVFDTELVVDAMGRGARTPAFLDNRGYGRPIENRAVMHGSYSSQFLRIPAGMVAEKLTFVFPESKRGTGGVLAAYENGTWLFTVGRVDGGEPPGDLAGMIGLAAEFMPPGLVAAVKAGEPRGEVCVAHNIRGVWRRYDKMPAFPAGLLVFGDAICSLNPIYGQGMTVAALEAVALRDCLSGGDADLSLRFFRAAAGLIGPLWSYNQARDRYMCPDGSISQRLINWRMDKRVAAAENDPAMTERLFRVGQLIDPPSVLSRPFWMRRVGVVAPKRRVTELDASK